MPTNDQEEHMNKVDIEPGARSSGTRRAVMQRAIDELAETFRADGAELTVLALDPEVSTVVLRVDLADVECTDNCVLPPKQLRATIAGALQRQLGEPVTVETLDPREAGSAPTHTTPEAAGMAGSLVVLDPCGVAPDDGSVDAGPDVGPLAGKTVAIRHDVLWPAFDWTVEEWTSSLERAGASVLSWRRAQGLKDDELSRADAEYEAILARADLAIAGLANCGSCTSWSVRDGLTAASRGLPTTVVATAHFESLAHLLAAEGGRPGLRVTVLPYPYSTLDEPTVREHARRSFTQLLDVLGASV
jgi:hypothetical protein